MKIYLIKNTRIGYEDRLDSAVVQAFSESRAIELVQSQGFDIDRIDLTCEVVGCTKYSTSQESIILISRKVG
jgi:hypothetical protein